MDKKGIDEREILWIFYFIVLVVIVLATINYIRDQASKSGLDKEYYARDLAYLLDTVAYANGDLEYTYVIKENKFDFFIGNVDGRNMVVVGGVLNNRGQAVESSKYAYNIKKEFGYFEKPSGLIITKINGEINVKKSGV